MPNENPSDYFELIESKNGNTGVYAEDSGLRIKDRETEYKLDLNPTNAEDGDVLVKRSDVLALSPISKILKRIKDNSGENQEITSVVCSMDGIAINTRNSEYNLKLDEGADEQDVILKRGTDLMLAPITKISLRMKDTEGVVKEKTSVTVNEEEIVLKVGGESYSLAFEWLLKAKAGEVMPLIPYGKRIVFGPLAKIGSFETTTDANGTKVVEKTSFECQTDKIVLKQEQNVYALNLANGQENSPLVKKGNTLTFGAPLGSSSHVVITTTVPKQEEAVENAVYFIYDEKDPFDPDQVPPTP